MADTIIILALLFEVVLFSICDRNTFGTWVTPFVSLACPYTAVAVLAFMAGPALGFVSLYMGSVVVWMVGLLIFWLFGGVLGFLLRGRCVELRAFAPSDESQALLWATRIGVFVIAILYFQLYRTQAAVGGWSRIGSLEFKAAFFRGILSHGLVLAIPVLTILLGTLNRKSSLSQKGITAVLLLFLIVGGEKGALLLPLAGGVLYRMLTGRTRISFRGAVAVVLITFVIFNLIYLVGMGLARPDSVKDPETFRFISRHYVFYMCAGVLAFGEAMRSHETTLGGEPSMIFAPFIDIASKLTGSEKIEEVGSSHEQGMYIDNTTRDPNAASNVYTSLGTLYVYLGPYAGALYVIFLSYLVYGILISFTPSTSAWLLAMYAFFCAQLVFGFFEFFFMLLNAVEVPVYCVLLALISRVFANSVRRTA